MTNVSNSIEYAGDIDNLISVDLYFDRHILNSQFMADLQSLLKKQLARWSKKLFYFRNAKTQFSIDIGEKNSLLSVLENEASENGELYNQLVEEFGVGQERVCGTAEIRGASRDIILVISFDELIFEPMAGKWIWGNSIHFDLENFTADDSNDRINSCRKLFLEAVRILKPSYATVQTKKEHDAKNMLSTPSIRAIGKDVSRYLPGVYWGNFFGPVYTKLIGDEALAGCSAHNITKTDDGFFIFLSEDPFDFGTSEYSAAEKQVSQRIGECYFYSIDRDNSKAVAPNYGLPKLPQHPRFADP